MSEQESEWQQEHEDKLEIFEYGLSYSEEFLNAVNEVIDEKLNDFYHEKVKPLELQLQKLGVTPVTEERDETKAYGEVNLLRYNPKDPFKEAQKNPNYHFDIKSDYYRFFEMLLDECLEMGWLKIEEYAVYDDLKRYWMWMFGCREDYSGVFLVEQENRVGADLTPMKLIEWKGNKSLCVYLLYVLTDRGYMTQAKKNEVIKAHFLPDSSTHSIATLRGKYHNKRDEAPTYPKERMTVLSIIDSCEMKTDE